MSSNQEQWFKAAQQGDLGRLKWLLLRRGSIATQALDKEGKSALHLAVEHGHVQCVQWLAQHVDVKVQDKKGRTPLHVAAQYGKVQCVQALVPMCDGNVRDVHERTPLHVAARYGHVQCVVALLECCPINAIDHNGYTALMSACVSGNQECVKALGPLSDVHLKNVHGNTARVLLNHPDVLVHQWLEQLECVQTQRHQLEQNVLIGSANGEHPIVKLRL